MVQITVAHPEFFFSGGLNSLYKENSNYTNIYLYNFDFIISY